MILQALVRRYEDTLDVPLGWQRREVSYALVIDEEGHLLDVNLQEWDEQVGKKTVRRKKPFVLPQEFNRSGKKAYETVNFLCDNGDYMLGLDAQKFAAALKFYESLLEDGTTPQARAILAYFRREAQPVPPEKQDILKNAAAAKFIFQVDRRFVGYDDEAMRKIWDDFYARAEEGGASVRCLVTGKEDVPLPSHNVLHLRGGQMSGCRLVSANEESFTSYGKTAKDRAADVGKYAAFAYVTALEALLKDPKRHLALGGDTLVFWAEKGGEAEEGMAGLLLNPNKIDEDAELTAAMKRIVYGEPATDYRRERPMYLLCLSPNAGRISVRFFYQCTFGEFIDNISAHYRRLEIVTDHRTPFEFLPLWLLLAETTVKGSAADAAPLLNGQLLYSILSDQAYPMTLYHAILTRIRAGAPITKAKAAIVKAVLIQNFDERGVTTVAINEQTDNKPYVLGRLFSVLERLQERANGSSNIRSRYFTSACANPSSAFPTLLSLSMHHAAKLDSAVFYEKIKGELIDRLDAEEPFPAALSLDDQGRFIVGYYHQTQWFFTKREDKKDQGEEKIDEQ